MEKFLSNGKLWLHKQNLPINYSRNRIAGKSPLEVIYGRHSMHLYDLAPLAEMGRTSLKGENIADLMKKLHEEIRLKIKELNAKNKKYAN